MIPKIIHYCWFGPKKKNALALKCIKSWQEKCPDYSIIEWNERNFDISRHPFLQYCFDNGKYAFVSDLARLLIVEEYGGIYLDVDVELKKNLDFLLENGAYFGFENSEFVNTGLGFGAIAHHPVIKKMISEYDDLSQTDYQKACSVPCPKSNTKALLSFGLVIGGNEQKLNDVIILPASKVNPFNDATGQLKLTEEVISINWYGKSWMSRKAVIRSRLTRPFHRLFGEDCFRWIKK